MKRDRTRETRPGAAGLSSPSLSGCPRSPVAAPSSRWIRTPRALVSLLDEAIERGRPEMRVEGGQCSGPCSDNGSAISSNRTATELAPPGSMVSMALFDQGRQSIDHPRRRTSRGRLKSAVRATLVSSTRAGQALGTPLSGHLETVAGSLICSAVPPQTRSNSSVATAQGAPRITARFLPFRVCSPVSNQKASSTQSAPTPVKCGLAILIDRRQPAACADQVPSTGGLGQPPV